MESASIWLCSKLRTDGLKVPLNRADKCVLAQPKQSDSSQTHFTTRQEITYSRRTGRGRGFRDDLLKSREFRKFEFRDQFAGAVGRKRGPKFGGPGGPAGSRFGGDPKSTHRPVSGRPAKLQPLGEIGESRKSNCGISGTIRGGGRGSAKNGVRNLGAWRASWVGVSR